MSSRLAPGARLVTFLGMLAACAPGDRSAPSPGTVAVAAQVAAPGATRKVLFLAIDGLRPDALWLADAPNLQHLATHGRYSGTSTSSRFTWTAPGWSTVLTGVWPEKHGVRDNSFAGAQLWRYPDLFARIEAKAPHVRTARFTSVRWLSESLPTGADLIFRIPTQNRDYATTVNAKELLRRGAVDAVFVYWVGVDKAGHAHGFSPHGAEYLAAIHEVDGRVGEVLDAIADTPTFNDESWLVVATTDHGGDERGKHGRNTPDHRTVFILLAGAGARQGTSWRSEPRHVDLVPTVLGHLDITPDPDWDLDGIDLLRDTGPLGHN